MNISLNWLTDYVDVASVPAGELAEVFTNIGLCCEAITQTDSDVVFDLEVTSNRPDCLGHIGVARELAAAMGLELKLPDLAAVATGAVAERSDSFRNFPKLSVSFRLVPVRSGRFRRLAGPPRRPGRRAAS